MNHNFYPQSKIDFINQIETDESIGRYFREKKELKDLNDYNRQYDSTNHYDMVRDSGRKDWR